MRKKIKPLVLALLLPFVVCAQEPSLDTLMNHVRRLSSARFEGRLAGTEGFDAAAQYVTHVLARYGVQPYQGDWEQMFEIERNQIENCTFRTYVNANDTRTVYVLGKDFACAGMTGRGYADASVVFCGYGIDDPTFNEYAKVDAQGKIVMVISGVPSFLPSSVTDRYASLRDKARVAQRHGACGLVVINMSNSCPPNEVQTKVYSGELPHLPTFPIIQPHRVCGERLLQGERFGLDSVVSALQGSMKPQSFHLRKKFEIEVNALYHPAALTENIVGYIPGSDPKYAREYIVVGAHLDHVGMQGRTCIFPGADDNATGVAALLETARLMQFVEDKPKRNVVFVLFSGGESQHVGSQIFVSNFSPLKRIEAFVGIESVGRGDSLAVLGNNQYPALWDLAARMDSTHTQSMVHGYKTDPRGDAASFNYIGIPSITITNFNGNKHNHVPSDIAENVDRQFLLKAAKLSFEVVYELSSGEYQGRSRASRRFRFE